MNENRKVIHEVDREQRATNPVAPVDYVAKAEKSLRAATQVETMDERRMLRMAEAQVYATLAVVEAGSAERRSNVQAALEIARHAVAQYESDTSGKPWQYNPMHDDGAIVAIALRDLVKALES